MIYVTLRAEGKEPITLGDNFQWQSADRNDLDMIDRLNTAPATAIDGFPAWCPRWAYVRLKANAAAEVTGRTLELNLPQDKPGRPGVVY